MSSHYTPYEKHLMCNRLRRISKRVLVLQTEITQMQASATKAQYTADVSEHYRQIASLKQREQELTLIVKEFSHE